MAAFSTLFDNFDDNSRDTGKWNQGNWESLSTTGVVVAETSQQLRITTVAGAADSRYSGFTSVNTYDLTGDGVFVRCVQKSDGGTTAETQFVLYVNATQALTIMAISADLRIEVRNGGTTTLATIPYVANSWWRIREFGSTIYFDTAPPTASNPPTEGQWVNQASVTNPFGVTALRAALVAGTWESVGGTGTAIFDGFNTATAGAVSGSPYTMVAEKASITIGSGDISAGNSLPSDTIFRPDSFWYQQIPTNVALHPNSANYAAEMVRQRTAYYGTIEVNTVNYSSPVYIAGPSQATQVVTQWNGQNQPDWSPYGPLQEMWNAVPIPSYAQPADGTDMEMTVYQPSTGGLWEFWLCRAKSGGGFEARWGGGMANTRENAGIWWDSFGATATGLPFIGGQITPEELQRGEIKHAIGWALVDLENSNIFSWPAQRSDGYNPSNVANRIPEGLRFRLDPTYNVDGSSLHPIAKIIAKAMQVYGGVVWDKAGALSIRCQNPKSNTQLGQPDPYDELFEGAETYQVMNGFPLDRLQFLPFDYGKVAASSTKMHSLFDSFTDNLRDTAKWNVGNWESLSTTGVTVVESGGQLSITPPADIASSRYSGYTSVNAYDLTDSYSYVRFTGKMNDFEGTDQMMAVYMDGSNALIIAIENGQVNCYQRASGTRTLIHNEVYNATNHAWFRIRESGGTAFFERAGTAAANPPAAWTTMDSVALGFAVTGVRTALVAGTWQSVASPGTASFDGYNTSTTSAETLFAATASLPISSPPANFILVNSAGTHKRMIAEHHTFAFNSAFTDFLYFGRKMPITTGSIGFASSDTAFSITKRLVAETRNFPIAASAAALNYSRTSQMDTASMAITGYDVQFLYGDGIIADTYNFAFGGGTTNLWTGSQIAGKSRAAQMEAFYRHHLQTQSEVRATLASTHHNTTPKKQAQNAAKQAEQAALKAAQARKQAQLDEIAELEDEILFNEQLLAIQPPVLHKPALEQLDPVALWQHLRYTDPAIREEEKVIELLLLNII